MSEVGRKTVQRCFLQVLAWYVFFIFIFLKIVSTIKKIRKLLYKVEFYFIFLLNFYLFKFLIKTSIFTYQMHHMSVYYFDISRNEKSIPIT